MYSLSNIKHLLAYLPKLYMNITQAVVSLVAQSVKNLPATQEIWVQSLGQEDPLEKEMATHSGTLAWKIPWTGEPGRQQSLLSDFLSYFYYYYSVIYNGEGTGTPLQYSCLENPMDGGTW